MELKILTKKGWDDVKAKLRAFHLSDLKAYYDLVSQSLNDNKQWQVSSKPKEALETVDVLRELKNLIEEEINLRISILLYND